MCNGRYFSAALVLCLIGLLPASGICDKAATTVQGSTAATLPVVSFFTLPALQVTTPIPGSLHVPDDFNGDGTSDLPWFNPSLSQMGYWTMNAAVSSSPSGAPVAATGMRTFNVTPSYFVGAVGDFNADGYADLVFTSANHDLWLWTNSQHSGWISSRIGATYPSQWQLVGAGDVNGDGHDDLLWLDPSECKFGYWTMNGATVAGVYTFDIACGYYPVSIGYYSPSNRLSILWTSPTNDLYIWDSTGSGFKSYNLTPYVGYYLTLTGTWAMGGGSSGRNMFIEAYGGAYSQYAFGEFTRVFDVNGNQTDVVRVSFGDGGVGGNFAVGAYLIQNNDINPTSFYGIDQSGGLLTTGGLQSPPTPFFDTHNSWIFPSSWYLVGAPANDSAAPPWQQVISPENARSESGNTR